MRLDSAVQATDTRWPTVGNPRWATTKAMEYCGCRSKLRPLSHQFVHTLAPLLLGQRHDPRTIQPVEQQHLYRHLFPDRVADHHFSRRAFAFLGSSPRELASVVLLCHQPPFWIPSEGDGHEAVHG